MKILALITMVLSFSSVGFSQIRTDVTCVNQSCLRFGWEISGVNNNYYSRLDCKYNDCGKFGWSVFDNRGMRSEISCVGRGCFYDGMIGRYTSGGYWVDVNVYCTGGDCLRYGWVEYQNGISRVTAQCQNNDCMHFGWTLFNNQRQGIITCKYNDCFRFGWIQDVY